MYDFIHFFYSEYKAIKLAVLGQRTTKIFIIKFALPFFYIILVDLSFVREIEAPKVLLIQ